MKLADISLARFWAKVDRRGHDECWPWTACVDSSGYGCFGVRGKVHMATHVSLTLDGRARPAAPENYALHSCDNPACVNPAHLRWGSQKENVGDCKARNRLNRIGPTSSNAQAVKLTDEQVKAILASPALGKDLALQFGVHKATVSDIRCGKTWRHLSARTV